MSKRISKKVREEAALICAIGASTPGLAESYILVDLYLGQVSPEAYALAMAAWRKVADEDADPLTSSAIVDAEAEALLRCGWSPGDEP